MEITVDLLYLHCSLFGFCIFIRRGLQSSCVVVYVLTFLSAIPFCIHLDNLLFNILFLYNILTRTNRIIYSKINTRGYKLYNFTALLYLSRSQELLVTRL